jgi:hypothetical protein
MNLLVVTENLRQCVEETARRQPYAFSESPLAIPMKNEVGMSEQDRDS